MLRFSRLESVRNPAREPDFRAGSTIAVSFQESDATGGPNIGQKSGPAVRGHVPERYPMLCDSASGPEVGLPGRISAGL